MMKNYKGPQKAEVVAQDKGPGKARSSKKQEVTPTPKGLAQGTGVIITSCRRRGAQFVCKEQR